MPTFHTPQPIAVELELAVGEIHITAGDRTDTVVDVRPADPAKKGDATAAEQTRVDFADGVLRVKGPKSRRSLSLRGSSEAVRVEIALPAGSAVRGGAGMAPFHAAGRLGECRFKSGMGDVQIDEAGPVTLKLAAGDVTLGRVAGHGDITLASGGVRVGTIDGTAILKNANGDIRIGEVVRGAVAARTAYGRIDVGVRAGVATWLDLHTAYGTVRNELADADRPAPGEDVVEVKARTAYGDVTIRRVVPDPVGGDNR